MTQLDGYRIKEALISTDKQLGIVKIVGSGTLTWNVGDLADEAGETSGSITVAGAALGDFVIVAPPADAIDLLFCGYVQAANTVEIVVQNEAGANRNMAEGVWKVLVLRLQ